MNLDNTIPSKYLPLLSRTFSPIVMNSLIEKGRSSHLKKVVLECDETKNLTLNMNFLEFFEWIYKIMLHSYRNEYIYKNTIANKILLGRHSLNTSVMFTEFNAGSCKADVVILNGTSNVYEIKSEYDSLDRIENQINAYMGVFDKVNVLVSKIHINKLENILPKEIGLLELTRDSTIRTIREAKSNKAQVKPKLIFDTLRTHEYLNIIKKQFGFSPCVSVRHIYKECLNLFEKLPPKIAHDEMVRILYKRKNNQKIKQFILNTPSCLKAYAVSANLTNRQIEDFNCMLHKKLGNILLSV